MAYVSAKATLCGWFDVSDGYVDPSSAIGEARRQMAATASGSNVVRFVGSAYGTSLDLDGDQKRVFLLRDALIDVEIRDSWFDTEDDMDISLLATEDAFKNVIPVLEHGLHIERGLDVAVEDIQELRGSREQ